MNVTRIAILGVAATAAGAAALLVRSMLGGQTPAVEASAPPPAVMTTDVLVASTTVPPGAKLEVGAVRWDAWPTPVVADVFITKEEQADLSKAVEGLVVRAPLFAGQPITNMNTVRSDVTGFMAATLMPGMRAVATAITAESSAGGFLLPNDRVDVILTYDVQGGSTASQQKVWRSSTVLRDVRLLAIDQNADPPAGTGSETQSRLGKTATLELSPSQAEILQRAVATGTVSLTLRSLGDSAGRALANAPVLGGSLGSSTVVRYGVIRDAKEIAGN
jgi:pilus assembly protein CpaB